MGVNANNRQPGLGDMFRELVEEVRAEIERSSGQQQPSGRPATAASRPVTAASGSASAAGRTVTAASGAATATGFTGSAAGGSVAGRSVAAGGPGSAAAYPGDPGTRYDPSGDLGDWMTSPIDHTQMPADTSSGQAGHSRAAETGQSGVLPDISRLSGEQMVRGVILAEILDKPLALRRRRR